MKKEKFERKRDAEMDYDFLVGKVREIIDNAELEIQKPCIGKMQACFFTELNTHRIIISHYFENEIFKALNLCYYVEQPKSLDDLEKFMVIIKNFKELLPRPEQANFSFNPEWQGNNFKCTVFIRIKPI